MLKQKNIIIVAPSLNEHKNVSGISAVAQYIIDNLTVFRYIHFVLGRKNGKRGGLFRIPDLTKKFFQWIKFLIRKDVLLVHYNMSLDRNAVLRDFFFICLTNLFRHPLVTHIHGGKYLEDTPHSTIIKRMICFILQRSNGIVCLSEKEKHLLSRYTSHNDRLFVLPNPVNIPDEVELTSKFSSSKPLHFLYIGRIEKEKGMQEMLESFKSLHQMFDNFVLNFAGVEQGKDHYIEQFQSLLHEKFVYHGVVTGKRKDALYRSSSIFLLPSHYEGLPMSMLEAMSYGLVPVVTAVGSIPLYVENGKTGYVIPPNSADDLIDTIKEILANIREQKPLGEAARQTILQKFKPDEYAELLTYIYKTVVKTDNYK